MMNRYYLLLILLSFNPIFSCPKYNRTAQYGDWIDADNDCKNTRAEVLIRDSQIKVSYSAQNPCLVETGLWIDPYTGDTLRDASKAQIDHVVPIGEAHKSGAWAWTQARRIAYYNFLDSNYHLVAVGASVNASKGDGDPAQWLPPLAAYHHQYALNWVKIKTHWGLKADAQELAALHTLLKNDVGITYPEEAPEDICTDTATTALQPIVRNGKLSVGENAALDGILGVELLRAGQGFRIDGKKR